ncbi:MAG TPA: universal stress protein [Casimicrobiaceae bacterium]|nr:universal stress protein [Casimicrobiaceae bacterium]
MLKVLLPVDGSENAQRATQKLIETLEWYKAMPVIELLAVHTPVHRYPNMSLVVSKEMIDGFYAEECATMLAPSRKILDDARVPYTALWRVGAIAETIVEQARQSASSMIYMGTRGMTGLANMVLGSVATRVLHLVHIPVVLVH